MVTNICKRPPYQRATAGDKKLDKQFLAWLRTQPCVIGGKCSGSVVAAHVRLYGRGGVGCKPLFSAVPLCWFHHGEQHQMSHTVHGNKSWWVRQADLHLSRWEKEG